MTYLSNVQVECLGQVSLMIEQVKTTGGLDQRAGGQFQTLSVELIYKNQNFKMEPIPICSNLQTKITMKLHSKKLAGAFGKV